MTQDHAFEKLVAGIRSRGYATDLIFPYLDGAVEDRGEYLCIRTPSNPDYMWGNFLLFKNVPQIDSPARWSELYERHFGARSWFKTLGWDGVCTDEGVLEAFAKLGFALEQTTILETRAPRRPDRLNAGIQLKPVQSADEWEQVTSNHVRYLCEGAHRDEQERFERSRFSTYRRLAEKGYGHWFGAWLGDQLAGDLGVFALNGSARFQEVLTYPGFRGQGVCRTMSYLAAQSMIEHHGASSVIALTDVPHALSAYLGAGFEKVGQAQGMRWYDLSLR